MELPEEGVNLETLERELVVQALRRTGGNQTKAATLLGLNRDQIRYRIEKFGLDKDRQRYGLSGENPRTRGGIPRTR